MKGQKSTWVCRIISCLLAAIISHQIFASPQTVIPGAVWKDNHGNEIEAHGGGIIRAGQYFYWFGEDRTPGLDSTKRFVACYQSTDLVHWTFRNRVLKQSDPSDMGPGWVLERPKVYYCDKTDKYVMYMHIDNSTYKRAHVGVAVCDTVDGNYKFLKDFRPLNHESRDIGQFVDDDGTGYLIFEDKADKSFHIAKLSSDYLTVQSDVFECKHRLEAGALVKYQGLYYVIGSQLTGWDPNPNQYATAKSLKGPWSTFQDIAPAAKNNYGAQSTFLLKIVGNKTTTVMYMGDVWNPQKLCDSRYMWLPATIGNGKFSIPTPGNWTIDTATGAAVMKTTATPAKK
ncbi:MAG TPA: family 43 glycosylhydrolase [Tepidisphaeraceae bacterium]|jgi:beta-xylosidase|nr:family 43 glycosylhydrolase [Tepidisphaeraceae bacterium]